MKKLRYRQILTLIILCMHLPACVKVEPKNRHEELYTVMDEMLRFYYHDVGFVISETYKVHQREDFDSAPPPPPGYIYYSRNLIADLHERSFIDSADIDFLFNQIDTLQPFILDSTKINKPLLRISDLHFLIDTYGRDSTSQILTKRFGSDMWIRISTPLYSIKGDKMLLDIDYYCGPLCGSGTTYLLEKKDGKWRVLFNFGNWIS